MEMDNEMEMGIEIEIEGVGGIYIFKLINNFFLNQDLRLLLTFYFTCSTCPSMVMIGRGRGWS